MDKKASQTSGPRNRGLRERGLSPPPHTHTLHNYFIDKQTNNNNKNQPHRFLLS